MRLVYFAWVRETLGRAEEVVDLPPGVSTVGALAAWLAARGGVYAEAFADLTTVRAAVNLAFAEPDDPVAAGDEVAFFPPVTGG